MISFEISSWNRFPAKSYSNSVWDFAHHLVQCYHEGMSGEESTWSWRNQNIVWILCLLRIVTVVYAEYERNHDWMLLVCFYLPAAKKQVVTLVERLLPAAILLCILFFHVTCRKKYITETFLSPCCYFPKIKMRQQRPRNYFSNLSISTCYRKKDDVPAWPARPVFWQLIDFTRDVCVCQIFLETWQKFPFYKLAS